ncbi:MAG TPA: MbcA/ParS/Xre antitoxin family protein [Rhizobiaceae bacterium]|nr:MbcA/ParS/Xre antitoxin family protein [Rhizobiaceae bacterium]
MSDKSIIDERVARLHGIANKTFGNEMTAAEFLVTPHDRLGGLRPVDCASSTNSLKQVEQVLDSILFGLPA